MTQYKNTNLLLLLFVVLNATTWLGSCKKDNNDQDNGITELLSFGPTGAQPGDTIRFYGRNLDKVTEIQFTGATVAGSGFISKSPTELYVIVPAETEKGFVVLKTPTGDITSKTQFNISVAAIVSSLTNVARPGETISIKGNYLNWVTGVTFNDGKEVLTFVSQSQTELKVTVPDDAQTGTLVLTYGGTEPDKMETTDTLHVTLPVATVLSPNPAKHADELTITGTDLDLATKVYFPGVAGAVTNFVSQTATAIKVKIPGATVNGPVTLEALSGVKTVSSTTLNMLMPSVTEMTPNPVEPETNLTIKGENLDLVSAITIQNADPITSFISQTANQIVLKVPKGVTEGKIILKVANSTLTVSSSEVLKITGAVPPPTIALPFYLDAVTSNWNGWTGGGWGGTNDFKNATPVREGDYSVKISYSGGWGSPFQLGGANINTSGYTDFKISIYGAPGSGGKTVQVLLNGNDGGKSQGITVVEGKWTDYVFPISSLTGTDAIKEIWVQETTGSGGFTIYLDAIGLN
jgi:hypothetical protein